MLEKSRFSSHKFFGLFSRSFGLAASISIVFLRSSSNFGGNLTFHAYIIAPIFTIFSICLISIEYIKTFDIKKLEIFNSIALLLIVPIFILHINNTDVISRRYGQLLKGPMDMPGRVSMLNSDLKNFFFKNEKLCSSDEVTKKIYINFLDKDGCDKGDLEEIYFSLKGIRSKSSLKSSNSLVYPWWAINPK